jgi:hypothetical protein
MIEARRSTNYLIFALFAVAVGLAGFAIFYFGGGTEPPPGDGNPQLLDRSVQPEAGDGPSPAFYHHPNPPGHDADRSESGGG